MEEAVRMGADMCQGDYERLVLSRRLNMAE